MCAMRRVLMCGVATAVVLAVAADVAVSATRPTCSARLLASGCARATAASSGLPDFSHVVIIMMENKGFTDVIGNPTAPYMNQLAQTYGLATEFYATAHPSLPNYIALTAGSRMAINTNCTSCSVNGRNLFDQLDTAAISWRGYEQDMPSPCWKGVARLHYVKRHDPMMYYSDITSNRGRCDRVAGFRHLDHDLDDHALPRFAFITPNVCNDTQTCSVAVGDRFLSLLVPRLLAQLGRSGVLIITYDEGESNKTCCGGLAEGGHPLTILAGPSVRRHVVSTTDYDHYSILRTVEDSWGLPELRNAACPCTNRMDEFFR